MLMSLMSKFVSPDSPEFHSHAIAKADDFQAKTIGSTDKSTFKQRKSVEQNRQMVAGYHAAGLIDAYRQEARFHEPSGQYRRESHIMSKPRENVPRQQARSGIVAPPRSTGLVSVPIAKPGFSEPSHRYNPYA